MSIISIIDLQLREILKLLKEDLKNSNITYNYLVCETETKFLDSTSMKLYFTEAKIKNETLLKIICDNCIKIVEMWNIDFEVLPEKKLKKRFFYADEITGKMFSSELDFHAIYLSADKFQFFSTIYGKETFVKNYDYKIVSIPEIASNCITIFNFIKQIDPKINSDFTPEYYFNHYNRTKRFSLQTKLKPYSKIEFSEFKVNLENYLIRYKFIFDKIDGADKIEFKQDTIDHLKSISNEQIHSKYGILLVDAIRQIEINFEKGDSVLNENVFEYNGIKKEPQQNESSKIDKVKKELHNDYFKDNAFEFWERLFENFNINETKRTDLRFMYEIMKYNGQIHKTVTVKNITDWINETYDFNIDKLQYTSIKSKSNENRMSIYNLIKQRV